MSSLNLKKTFELVVVNGKVLARIELKPNIKGQIKHGYHCGN